MEDPHIPIGLVAKVLAWFRDFFAMPARIARLEAIKMNQGRQLCDSCGKPMKISAIKPQLYCEELSYSCIDADCIRSKKPMIFMRQTNAAPPSKTR